MVRKLLLVLHTVRYLKLKQVRYQLWYRLKKAGKLEEYDSKFSRQRLTALQFSLLPPVYKAVLNEAENRFVFLNIEEDFPEQINWNFRQHGKLWNYNLQYANYLLQQDVSYTKKKEWLFSLYEWLEDGRLPLEPYPVSLRSINVIRLLVQENDRDDTVLKHLHAELDFLSNRLEFHLLGNHLLENLFALLMGGVFFGEQKWMDKAQKLLVQQLDEQVLPDGAHFELSPMYHQIILFRLLELIDWYTKWKNKEVDFESFLRDKAAKMLSWLKQISFSNGDIPHFNDSAEGIAYGTGWLLHYGAIVGIAPEDGLPLKESGYRCFNIGNYECRVDVAPIGAAYQPGHAHADALSFVLYIDGKPFLAELGTSTYQIGNKRNEERSTQAHNTVVVNNQNQSELWGGFRVGKRARVDILQDGSDCLAAQHDGYKSLGMLHRRSFRFNQNEIIVEDKTEGRNDREAIAYFYIHPSVGNSVTDQVLHFQNAAGIEKVPYRLADGYNRYRQGTCYKVTFKEHLITVLRTR